MAELHQQWQINQLTYSQTARHHALAWHIQLNILYCSLAKDLFLFRIGAALRRKNLPVQAISRVSIALYKQHYLSQHRSCWKSIVPTSYGHTLSKLGWGESIFSRNCTHPDQCLLVVGATA